ncbi:potassium transporter [Aerococcus sp. JJEM-2022a]|uniref:Potassium transporter n=1 Tax=Aerococcus loyolae TaxID=2976809 RepID=A0ABT4BWR5_9LACT|nr:potassium transporter TrkG [Aerococcus loyolae]MCY3024704.1 potassium transporter [Aerococcus loyolae]
MLNFFKRLNVSQKIAFSFMSVILVGPLLLSLPIAHTATSTATYLDHLFISVSAVCVTGLWTESIYDSYNIIGQMVMLALIQTGGLGLMTIIGSIYHTIGQNIGLKNQIATGAALNHSENYKIGDFLTRIIRYTAIIEGTGFILLSTYFVPRFGWAKGLWNGLFTAISAFCNAGFDIMGNNSLIDLKTVPVLNWTIMALIVLGGIGFSVWFDITNQIKNYAKKSNGRKLSFYFKHLSPHTKLVLIVTGLVILIGASLFLLVEWDNPGTIGPLSLGDKIMTAFFQTITMRTAGFATVDYTACRPVSLLIFVLTMFIGGGAGGTAGGLKVTTFALTIMLALREVRQIKHVNFDRHTIPDAAVRQSFTIALMYVSALFIGSALLLTFDPGQRYLHLLFEAISALATVGVSAGLTPNLSLASHIVLMLLMFVGRIGPMTMALSLRRNRNNYDIRYAKTNILIG